MPNSRKAIHAFLSEQAHDAWHDYATVNGVSVSGLLEVFGAYLERAPHGYPVITLSQAVLNARKLDAQRRRRLPTTPEPNQRLMDVLAQDEVPS
jgi:hypothetical protein